MTISSTHLNVENHHDSLGFNQITWYKLFVELSESCNNYR